MRGHLGVRIALCEKLLGRPSWDAALPRLPGRQGWGGGRKGMGMGGDGEWSTNGLVTVPMNHRRATSDTGDERR